MRKTLTINHLDADLTYRKYGTGDHIVLGFHGYGQDGSVFEAMHPVLKNHTIYTFDLFYHGGSIWRNGDLCLTEERWKEFMEAFLNKEQIDLFDLIGFSMGCRLVFSIIKSFQDKIRRVTLIAPDGISDSFWYTIATKSEISRSVFRFLIQKPALVIKIIKLFRKMGLSDYEASRIARSEMMRDDKRFRLFNTWILFRKMQIMQSRMTILLNHNHIRVTIVVAENDPLVRWRTISNFTKGLDDKEIIILNCPHGQLVKGTADWMRKSSIQ